MKQCAKCSTIKELDQFPNHKKTKDGKCSWCRACHTAKSAEYRAANPEKVRESGRVSRNKPEQKEKYRQYELTNKDKRSAQSRLRTIYRKYGLTPDEYNQLLHEQKNRCKICGLYETDNTFGYLYVDHCHSSNKVRGLLCHNCNSMLGYAKDNQTTLLTAIEYLREHSNEEV